MFSVHLPLTSQMDAQQCRDRAHTSVRLVWGPQLSGLSSKFKPFSRLCTSLLQSTLVPTKEQGRANTPHYRSLQGRHHLHTATCPIPSGYQAGQREQHLKILTQHHFNSKCREAALSSLWSCAAKRACVVSLGGSCLSYSLLTSWQRGQRLEKTPQQL